jgi:hypothetical protein
MVILQVEKHANFLNFIFSGNGAHAVYEGGTELLTL